jgi:hypothetical protein
VTRNTSELRIGNEKKRRANHKPTSSQKNRRVKEAVGDEKRKYIFSLQHLTSEQEKERGDKREREREVRKLERKIGAK